MDKRNIAPFYIGQTVMYITGYQMPKNSLHTVSDVWGHPCGCHWTIAINGATRRDVLTPLNPTTLQVRCVECHHISPASEHPFGIYLGNGKGGAWNPNSFRAVEEIKASIMTFTKVQEFEKQKAEPLILINN